MYILKVDYTIRVNIAQNLYKDLLSKVSFKMCFCDYISFNQSCV